MSRATHKLWKCSIYFYIMFYGASGLLLGVVTSYVLVRSFSTREFYDPIQTSICFLYAPTLMTFVVAAVGFRAMRRKNYLLLKCFSVSKVAVIVAEIIGSVWNFVSLQLLPETALPVFQDKFADVDKDNRNVMWDNLQRRLKCCGIHGAFDYKTLNIVPLSCCDQASTHQFPRFCVSVHSAGCLDAFVADMSSLFAMLSVLSAALALTQIPGVFTSWFFANRVRRKKRSGKNMKMYQIPFPSETNRDEKEKKTNASPLLRETSVSNN